MARQQSKKRPKRKPVAQPATAQLAPEFQEADPESPRSRVIVFRAQGGVRVDEFNAMTLGAVFACVRVIAETIAGLPWQEFKQAGSNRVRMENDPVDWLLDTQANPETPAFQFRETLVAHALTWGNGYAEIERDGAGRPLWLWQITPDRVSVERDDNGRIVYCVNNGHGSEPTYLPAADVYHLRGLGFDGLVGYSVIAFAARSIGVGIGVDQASGSFFENDSTPGGILSHPNRLSPEGQNNLRESWQKTHGGAKNQRKVAILEEGMTWTQTGIPPKDSQMIEARQITPAEICRWFRVPPHKIADLARATFSNIEQQSIEFVSDTLMPWIRRLETEANIKLFGRTNRGRMFTRINVNGLLRGDSASRSAFYNSLLDRGVFCINNVLSLEDLNEIGPDGDKRFVPLNMQLLENAGEEPPPGMAPAAPPDKPTSDGTDNGTATPDEPAKSDLHRPPFPIPAPCEPEVPRIPKPLPPDPTSHLRPIVLDVCQRIARREKGCGVDAQKVEEAKREAWVAECLAKHEEYCRAQLAPVFQSLAAISGMPLEVSEKFVAVEASLNRDRLAAQAPEFWGQEGIQPDSLFVPFTKGAHGS